MTFPRDAACAALRSFALVSWMGFAACGATASVQVTQLRGLSTPIARIYVISDPGAYPPAHAHSLAHALARAFSDRTEDQRTFVMTGLELTAPPWTGDAEAFAPDAVLTVRPSWGFSGGSPTPIELVQARQHEAKLRDARRGAAAGLFFAAQLSASEDAVPTEYEGTLREARTGRIVWTAEIAVDGGSQRARAIANAMIEQMTLARLLRPAGTR